MVFHIRENMKVARALVIVLLALSKLSIKGETIRHTHKGLTKIPTNVASSVTFLDLSRNSISSIQHDDFNNKFPDLTSIWLNDNRISSVEDGCFEGTKLSELKLNHNQITYVPQNLPPSITTLDLDSNFIISITSADFNLKYPNLTSLWLEGNDISTIGQGCFAGTQLSKLSLSNNNLGNVPDLRAVEYTLTELMLISNKIYYMHVSDFNYLEKLTDLYISKNPISSLPDLSEMNLSALGLVDLDIECCLTSWLRGNESLVYYVHDTTCSSPSQVQWWLWSSISDFQLQTLCETDEFNHNDTNGEPTSSKPDLKSTHEEPTSSEPTLISTNEEPTSSEPTPISTNEEPTSSEPTLTSTNEEPTSSEPTLIITNEEPTSSKPTLISTNEEPTSSESTLRSTNEESTSSELAPISTNKEPTSSTSSSKPAFKSTPEDTTVQNYTESTPGSNTAHNYTDSLALPSATTNTKSPLDQSTTACPCTPTETTQATITAQTTDSDTHVSDQSLSKQVSIAANIPFIGSVLMKNTFIGTDLVTTSIMLPGKIPKICFEISFNEIFLNGSSVVEKVFWSSTGQAYCQQNASVPSEVENYISDSSVFFETGFDSSEVGSYRVNIGIINDTLDDVMSNETKTIPLPCSSPIMNKMKKNSSGHDPHDPILHYQKDVVVARQSFFDMIIQCEATDQVDWKWKLHEMKENSTLTGGYSFIEVDLLSIKASVYQDSVTIEPFNLNYGLYRFTYTIHMYGTSTKPVAGMQYFRIVPSPLEAAITGGEFAQYAVNTSQKIEAYPGTQDPDDKSSTAADLMSKLTLTWGCTEPGMSFDPETIMQDLPLHPLPTNKPGSDPNKICFGQGRQLIEVFNSSEWQLDTRMFDVGDAFTLWLKVKRGERVAFSRQTIEIVNTEPPLIELKCDGYTGSDNCAKKVNPQEPYIANAACLSSCGSSQVFEWILHSADAAADTLPSIPHEITSGNRYSQLELGKSALKEGSSYTLEVVVKVKYQNGYEKEAKKQISLTANMKPTTGNCTVYPLNGTALSTFDISLWGSIKEEGPMTPYVHTYEIGHFEATFSIPKLMLPVGRQENGYQVDVNTLIYDEYGSYATCKSSVIVKPPSNGEEDWATKAEDILRDIDVALLTVNAENSILRMLAISATLQIFAERAVDITEGKDLDPVARLHLMETEEGQKQIEEEENRNAIQEDVGGKLFELIRMNISVELRLNALEAVSIISQGVNTNTPANIVVSYAARALTLRVETEFTVIQETILECVETATEHLEGMTADQVLEAGEYAFKTIDEVMKATILQLPKPIEEVGQDIPVSEAEEYRIRQHEENFADNIEKRKVALIDAVTLVSTNMGERLYDIMQKHNKSEFIIQEGGIYVSAALVRTEDLSAKIFGEDDIARVKIRSMAEDLEGGVVPFAVFFQVLQVTEVLHTLDDTADGLTAGTIVCSLRDHSYEQFDIGPMLISLTLEFPQNVTENVVADQSNATIDSESGAIYLYIPVDKKGETLMLQIEKSPWEAESLKFMVVVKFNASTNFSEPSNFPNETYYDMMEILPNYSRPNPLTFYFPEDILVGTGSIIGLVPFDENENTVTDTNAASSKRKKRTAGDVGGSSNYTIPGMEIKSILPVCKAYDTIAERWLTDGCKVDPSSKVGDLKCSCSKMTANVRTYSGGFKSPKVNFIAFRRIADNFLALAAGNPVVLSIIVLLLVLWVILSLVLRRFDHKDIEKWSVAPLLDNKQHYSEAYKISVFTGMRRYSGTRSRVCFLLTGDNGDTGVRVLDDGRERFFPRNSVRHFVMTTDQQLGNMLFLRVWHDSSGAGNTASWYLTKIVVENLKSHRKFFFLCNKWLAVDEEDGKLERILPGAGKDEVTGFSHLFYSKAKKSLSEDHLWLSVASRPSKSHFTRCQRLACCVLLLFTSMLANCMFYRTDENTEGDFVIQLGPFVVSASVILISIYSSLVVIPPNLIVTQLFKRSKIKMAIPEKEEERKAMSTKQAIRGRLKQKYWFPQWVIYLSWTITILITLLCGILVIFYSLEWGAEKSNKWMSSLLLSTLQSVILVQPLKVLFLAAMVALVFRTLDQDNDEEEESYRRRDLEAHNSNMASDEDLFVLDPAVSLGRLNSAMVQVAPSGQHLDAIRLRRDREKRSQALIGEIIFHTCVLLLISFIVWGNNDLNVYRMNANYYNLFDGDEVTDGESFWDWTQNTVIPNLYSMYDYRPKPTTKRERKFTTDQYSFRVGPSRLRQLRISPGKCAVSPEINRVIKTCNIGYSWYDQEERVFLPKWEQKPSANYTPESRVEDAFVYKTAIELVGLPYWGFFATYSGGGYIADLGITEGQARKMVEKLKNNNWVDIYTRMVSFEFTTYNPNTNLFTYVLYAIEFPPSGGAFSYPRITSFQVYDGVGNSGKIILVSKVIYCFILIYFILKMCFNLKSMGVKKYFSEPWNVVEVIFIAASLIALVMFILKIFVVNSIQRDLQENPDEYTNYQVLVEYINTWNAVLGLITFIATIKFLRILRFNQHIGELASTMRFLRCEILQFLCFFLILMSSFACLANLSFGRQNQSLSTFSMSLQTLFSMLIGRFKLGEFEIPDQVMGSFFFISYSIIIFFITLNFFIGSLTYGYAQVRSNSLLQGDDYKIIDYMIDVIKKILFKTEPQQQRPITPEVEHYLEPLDLLERRIESIDQLLSTKRQTTLRIQDLKKIC